MEFRLPELGEGIESATVTAVLVKPGDTVKAGQNVVSVETDKASVDVPVESAGTVGAGPRQARRQAAGRRADSHA